MEASFECSTASVYHSGGYWLGTTKHQGNIGRRERLTERQHSKTERWRHSSAKLLLHLVTCMSQEPMPSHVAVRANSGLKRFMHNTGVNGTFATETRLLLLMLIAKVKSLPLQEVATAHACASKPHVNCMSATEFAINKAHASVHLPQHAVHHTVRSQT